MLELQLALLSFTELIGLALDLALLQIEIHEHRDLRAEHIGIEGLEHVVHGTHRVSLEHVRVFLVDGAQEDDRDRARPLARLDDLRDLEAVHARHLHIQKDRREIFAEHVLERFGTRVGANQALTQRLENRFEREQILRPVVHEEKVDLFFAHTTLLAPTVAGS